MPRVILSELFRSTEFRWATKGLQYNFLSFSYEWIMQVKAMMFTFCVYKQSRRWWEGPCCSAVRDPTDRAGVRCDAQLPAHWWTESSSPCVAFDSRCQRRESSALLKNPTANTKILSKQITTKDEKSKRELSHIVAFSNFGLLPFFDNSRSGK